MSIAIRNESAKWMARNFSAQSRVSALTLLTVRGAERAPPKRTCATSAPADARRERGRSALGRRDARIAAQGRQAATGRYSDQAGCRSWADEARILRRTGKRGRSDRQADAPARPCQPRGPPPPRCAEESEAFGGEPRRLRSNRAHERSEVPARGRAERSDAKCAGPGSDRPRTQSNDCGAGRAQCGTAHFAREYRWGGGPRTLTGTAHKHTPHTPRIAPGDCAATGSEPTALWRRMGLVLRAQIGGACRCGR
jgi:hypothetical protein